MRACVVPELGACSASHELPSSCDAPNTCTVHAVMHSQFGWRARAHGGDGRTTAATGPDHLLLVWATQFFFYIAQAHVSGLASLILSPAFTRKAKRREHVLSAHIHRARSICTLYLAPAGVLLPFVFRFR